MIPIRVVIIGGGASGMLAALTAAGRKDVSVLLLERHARLGRKLLATGNGRCNLSNRNASVSHYHGHDPSFAAQALRAFSVQDTLDYFRGLGLLTVCRENGRLYPLSDQANSVADVLRLALAQRGVCVRTGYEVSSIEKTAHGFQIHTAQEPIGCDAVIVCAGGLAGSKLGGSNSGYTLLKQLGHTCSKLYPALVQIRTDTAYVRALKGIRTDCAIRLLQGNRLLAENSGEVQFTEFGVSGPAIFEISRAVSVSAGDRVLNLDLLPAYSYEEILSLLQARAEAFPTRPGEDFLTGVLHNRLGRTLVRYAGLSLEQPCREYGTRGLQKLAHALKYFRLPVLAPMGMDAAQVTAGGILTAEFLPDTLESRLVKNLYACGEVLDIDGDCGGYNLQWAWSSGRLAGQLKGTL